MNKPQRADGYQSKDLALVRSAALTLATYLGDYLPDLVIIGGLVPSLLIPQPQDEAHVGTLDLDLGLSLALLDESRYARLAAHLRSSGFEPDLDSRGRPANHRWKAPHGGVTVDFLIPPREGAAPGGTKRVIDEHLSAVLNRALPLAFVDRREVSLSGVTLAGETVTRTLWVCGPGAFVVLKAHASRGRGERKDSYDLLYLLRNFGHRYLEDVADALRPLLTDPVAREAVTILEEDYCRHDNLGPMRAAAFLNRQADIDYRSDLAGAVFTFLEILRRPKDP